MKECESVAANARAVKVERVTRDLLRDIKEGETVKAVLPDAKAIDSGKSTAYQLQNLLGCKFSVNADYTERTLAITRLGLC